MKHKKELVLHTNGQILDSDVYICSRDKYIVLNNPSKLKDNSEVGRIQGIIDGEIAGEIYPFTKSVILENECVRATCGSNYWVAPEFRKYGFGMSIIAQFVELNKIHVLGMVSTAAQPVYEMFDFKFLTMPQYATYKNVDKIVKRHIKGFLGSLISMPINAVLKILFGVYTCYAKNKFSEYELIEKSVEEINYSQFEDITLNDSHKYKELHDKNWLKYILNYQPEYKGCQRFIEIYKNEQYQGFLIQKIRDMGPEGHWKNFVSGQLIEWGSKTLTDKDLFSLSILSFPKTVDVIKLAHNDKNVVKGIKLLPKIKSGFCNFAIRSEIEGYDDIFDWNLWRLRVACGDNAI